MFNFRKTIRVSQFIAAFVTLSTSYKLNLANVQEKKLSSANPKKVKVTEEITSAPVAQLPSAPDYNSSHQSHLTPSTAEMLIVDHSLQLSQHQTSKLPPNSLQQSSLFIFLIIFILYCLIFYPLFLFYRRLLRVKGDILLDSDPKSSQLPLLKPSEPQIDDLEQRDEFSNTPVSDTTVPGATVSKLQIAFSPQACTLRQKLQQISASAEREEALEVVDLLCKTVLALVSHQDWTHVSYSSISLPLDEVKAEFDYISLTERRKCRSRQPTPVYYERSVDNSNDSYNYVVVTLIICTTHTNPLFDKILTEAQLIEELAKLGNMERESLIKFELLWNPQSEATYLSNEQLLTEYSELIRLL
ncbi:MAG: DUF1517 domain-containing protein [Cyanobacteria bacterium J06621_8]